MNAETKAAASGVEMVSSTSFMGHKFRALNENFWKNLVASTVYFSAPRQLNDPYDCQIDLMKAITLANVGRPAPTAALEARWKAFVEMVTGPAADCGVFSLSGGDIRGLQERLIWAHYADNHRGVCVTYEIPDAFVYQHGQVGCAPVNYGEEVLIEALRRLDWSGKPDFDADVMPVITAFLTTKAKEWEYEKEVRYFSKKSGLVEFDRSWLRQVCFGLNTSSDDRKMVIDAINRLGYPNCAFAEVFHSGTGLYELGTRTVTP